MPWDVIIALRRVSPSCPSGMKRSMNTDQPAMLPQAELESRDVADAHQELWIAPSGCKIQPVSDAARALSTCFREEGAHARVAQCGVEIRQTFFISAREPRHFAKNMLANIDFKPPALEHSCAMARPIPGRRACRRYKPHLVTGPQRRRHQDGIGFGHATSACRIVCAEQGRRSVAAASGQTPGSRKEPALRQDADVAWHITFGWSRTSIFRISADPAKGIGSLP